MRLFDRVEPESLDQREQHLWLLTTTVIVVLVAGLALLMYPAVFSQTLTISGKTLRVSFFGFCALSVLLIGYLIDRQLIVRQLRKKIMLELKRNIELRRHASRDVLDTLPGLAHFLDRLTMEHRRAAILNAPLSVAVVKLTPSANISDAGEFTEAQGDAVKAMSRRLRREDSISWFCPGFFGVILPELKESDSPKFLGRLEEGLQDAAGVGGRFSSTIHIISYPAQASTARELEEKVRSLLPKELVGEPLLDEPLFTEPQV